MVNSKIRWVATFLILGFGWSISSLSNAGLFGPDNYEDCILEGVKDAKTDLAVKLVMSACLDKFPTDAKPSTSVKDKQPHAVFYNNDFVCKQRQTTWVGRVTFDPQRKLLTVGDSKANVTHVAGGKVYADSITKNKEGKSKYYWILNRNTQMVEVVMRDSGDTGIADCDVRSP